MLEDQSYQYDELSSPPTAVDNEVEVQEKEVEDEQRFPYSLYP